MAYFITTGKQGNWRPINGTSSNLMDNWLTHQPPGRLTEMGKRFTHHNLRRIARRIHFATHPAYVPDMMTMSRPQYLSELEGYVEERTLPSARPALAPICVSECPSSRPSLKTDVQFSKCREVLSEVLRTGYVLSSQKTVFVLYFVSFRTLILSIDHHGVLKR
jgi:hypothetical protein